MAIDAHDSLSFLDLLAEPATLRILLATLEFDLGAFLRLECHILDIGLSSRVVNTHACESFSLGHIQAAVKGLVS